MNIYNYELISTLCKWGKIGSEKNFKSKAKEDFYVGSIPCLMDWYFSKTLTIIGEEVQKWNQSDDRLDTVKPVCRSPLNHWDSEYTKGKYKIN